MSLVVNGGYGNWGSWSDCSITCGKMKGTRRRDRMCNLPEPQNGGKDCSELGKDSETKECTPPIKKCPGSYKEKNILPYTDSNRAPHLVDLLWSQVTLLC